MNGIARALRGVVLSTLVVSTILVGAVSFHEMSEGSHAGADVSHAMAVSLAADTASHTAAAHDHGTEARVAQQCDGDCGLGPVIVGVLCVAAGVAMLIMIFWPRPAVAAGILSTLLLRIDAARGAVAEPTTPSLSQLAVCRT